MSQPMIGHRGDEAKELLEDITPKLKPVFGTEEEVLVLAGSGTAGLETAVVNTVKPPYQFSQAASLVLLACILKIR